MFKVFCHSVPLARHQLPNTLNKRSAYACDAGAEIRSMAILDRSGYPASQACTAIQNCTGAHFRSIVGKFSLLDQHQQMLLQELQRHACLSRAVGQSPQCRIQLSALLSFSFYFVFYFFVLVSVLVNEFIIFSFLPIFVLVFVNENHTVSRFVTLSVLP